MGEQILNRRENVYTSKTPAHILDAAEVEKIVSDAGFVDAEALATALTDYVKNTDYASTSAAGLIKVQTSAGSAVSGGGALIGVERTLEQYESGARNMFISKGTLENVIQDVIERMLATALNDSYTQAEVGTTWRVLLRKAEGGPSIDFATQT